MNMPNKRYTFREIDEELVAPIKDLVADIVYPGKRYLGYRNGPIIRLKDGRTVPVLQYLAKLKYRERYDMATQEAIWTDTNWYNATPDNITLLERKPQATKRQGRPSKLNLGVPYGHPDYQRRYIAATIDKQREYRRKRYVKKRYAATEALDAASNPIPDDPQIPDESSETMSARLDDILLGASHERVKPADLPTPSTRPPVTWHEVQSSEIPSQFSKDFLEGIAAAPVPSAEEVKRAAPDDVFGTTREHSRSKRK
jgi:hypothetical protein